MKPRTIFLLQNDAGRWYVRTGAANGEKISTEEDHPDRAKAVRAFIAEGRHQPFAHMVVLQVGRRPVTIRAGRAMPDQDREAEEFQKARIRAAFAMKEAP